MKIAVKFPTVCPKCNAEVPEGTTILWDPAFGIIECLECFHKKYLTGPSGPAKVGVDRTTSNEQRTTEKEKTDEQKDSDSLYLGY